MNKKAFLIVFFMFQGFLKLFSQNVLLQEFSCAEFDLRYPKKWKVDTSENQYSFYYSANLGELRISIYESKNLSEKELKQILLDTKENKELNPDIKSLNTIGNLFLEYRYTEDNFVTHLKVIQNNRKMYFLSLYWKEDSWNDFKDLLLESYNSFKSK